MLFEDGHAQAKVRQGVTTEVLGEHTSGGPNKGRLPAREVDIDGESARIVTLADYLNGLDRSGISVNVATYAGLRNIWGGVMGTRSTTPPPIRSRR